MKLTVRQKGAVLAVAVGGLIAQGIQAQPNEAAREKTLRQDSDERYVLVTGSHIPQKVKLRSIGTDTPYNIRIYTQRELQTTGRSTPGEALQALDPSITLSGRH